MRLNLGRQISKISRFLKRHLLTREAFVLAIAGVFVFGGSVILWAATLEIPDLRGVSERKIAQSTKIYDRTGKVLLYDLSKDITRTIIPISQISSNIQKATVAIEDEEFYTHKGIKPRAILRAVLVNITTLSFSQGGSTITQQVIKNALLTKDKTPTRKLKEWALALKLEKVLSKDDILEIYLNENPYGGSLSGVEEASQAFFGKHASDVDLAEAAYLAALPQAPSYYSPYGNHRDELEKRKNLVLERMLTHNFITQDEYDRAKSQTVEFLPPRPRGIIAPHFVFYVQEQLESKYGSRVLEDGGLKVITTLDVELEKKAEEVVKKYALENAEKFHATNAAIVATDPRTGEILVMAGSRDYFDTEIPGNFNIALAERQPGSSFKPFVYAAAFTKGFTPETVVFDVRTQFSTNCSPNDITNSEPPCYSPVNYDNVFRGPVTLRAALAQSLNIPAVKVLYLAGLGDALRLAKSMGISTLTDIGRYGLTLVLGGGEVRLIDMVGAYGGFATGGVKYELQSILEVQDHEGTTIEKAEFSGTRVLPETVASQINDILSDNAARTPAFGATSALFFDGRDVAVKTGTTNDYRDAWVLGYTPNLVAGAWAGNNDNTPMEKKVAGFIVAPLWHEFMVAALATRPVEYFTRIDQDTAGYPPMLRGVWQGGSSVVIDTRTGAPADDSTPQEFRRESVSGGVHSILHSIDKNNPTGPAPINPSSDPQYRFWELPVRIWAASHGESDGTFILEGQGGPVVPPQTTPTNAQTFSIISPSVGQTPSRSAPLTISVSSSVSNVVSVTYTINGTPMGTATAAPFSMIIVPSALNLPQNGNLLRATARLQDGSDLVAERTFNLK